MATRMLFFVVAALGVVVFPSGAEQYWIAYEGNDFPENEGWWRVYAAGVAHVGVPVGSSGGSTVPLLSSGRGTYNPIAPPKERCVMTKLPESYQRVHERHPELMQHYERLGEAAANAGPLDAKTIALVKLGMCVGAGLEGGAHASVRKALAAGCTADELRHAALVAVTTLGFPATARARAWVEDLLSDGD